MECLDVKEKAVVANLGAGIGKAGRPGKVVYIEKAAETGVMQSIKLLAKELTDVLDLEVHKYYRGVKVSVCLHRSAPNFSMQIGKILQMFQVLMTTSIVATVSMTLTKPELVHSRPFSTNWLQCITATESSGPNVKLPMTTIKAAAPSKSVVSQTLKSTRKQRRSKPPKETDTLYQEWLQQRQTP